MAELHPADLSIIEKYAERALLLLASRGIFPTPIDEVAATAGICEMLDLDELPEIPRFRGLHS